MTTDFSEAMAGRTNKQLADIVTIKRTEYEPEALKAAEEEIARRKIDISAFYTEEQIAEAQFAAAEDNASLAFRWQHKAGTVLLPLVIGVLFGALSSFLGHPKVMQYLGFPVMVLVHYLIYKRLKDTGHTQMARDFSAWIAYTLFIYIGLLLALGLGVYIAAKIHSI